jgi:ribosomal protein S11
MDLIKKECKCYIRVTRTNVFVTLIDLSGKVIVTKSGGLFCTAKTVRRKMRKSWFLAERVGYEISVYLLKENYKEVDIIIKGRVNRKVRKIIYFFKKFKVGILRQESLIPHNGLRKKKARRM